MKKNVKSWRFVQSVLQDVIPLMVRVWYLLQYQFHGEGCASRGKSAGDIRCLRIVYYKYVTRKCFTLKINVKVTEYNIRHGAIRWRISISINVTHDHFRQLSPFSRYSHSNIRNLENIGQGHDRSTFGVAPFDGKYVTSYLTTIECLLYRSPFSRY